MPELPEVETVVNGIREHLIFQSIIDVGIYHHQLRHPLQADLSDKLKGQTITHVYRRAKYIIIQVQDDLLVHLGMSGKLVIKDKDYQPQKHDHIILSLSNGKRLVFNDPRRFGMYFWTESAERKLDHLGLEPLSQAFDAEYLYNHQKGMIKQCIMDQSIVVGVGNIYACEALYHAKIPPQKRDISQIECQRLVESIKDVLSKAILAGGSSLKDYRTSDDNLGYFQQMLSVYGQKYCPKGHLISNIKISSRSSYCCPICQK